MKSVSGVLCYGLLQESSLNDFFVNTRHKKNYMEKDFVKTTNFTRITYVLQTTLKFLNIARNFIIRNILNNPCNFMSATKSSTFSKNDHARLE